MKRSNNLPKRPRSLRRRLDEAVRAIARVTNGRGRDLARMSSELQTLIEQLPGGSATVRTARCVAEMIARRVVCHLLT